MMKLTKIFIALIFALLVSPAVFAQKADKRLSVTLVRWAYT
jgi:hypothetical protein